MPPKAYSITQVFDEHNLPVPLLSEHQTKDGVWAVIRVIDGAIDLIFHDPRQRVRANPQAPAVIAPQAAHHVETVGPVRLQIEFYREAPDPTGPVTTGAAAQP